MDHSNEVFLMTVDEDMQVEIIEEEMKNAGIILVLVGQLFLW